MFFRLDSMLDSGIYAGEITEVYGYSASGKTQFCVSFAVSVVTQTQKQVVYVDADLSICPQRLFDIIKARKLSSDLFGPMAKIQICNLFKASHLLDLIEHISYDLTHKKMNSKFQDVGVIIIDSLTGLISLDIHKAYSLASKETDPIKSRKLIYEAGMLLSQLAYSLKVLASRFNIAVIVVNSQASLKNNWKNMCAVSIRITKEGDRKREIKVTQSNRIHIESVNEGTFIIKKSGITSFEKSLMPRKENNH